MIVGTPALSAWIAQFAFWVLLILGVLVGELNRRTIVASWALVCFALPRVPTYGGVLVAPYTARRAKGEGLRAVRFARACGSRR